MKNHCIVALFKNIATADIGLLALEKANFTTDSVSTILHRDSAAMKSLAGKQTDHQPTGETGPDAAATGGSAAIGGMTGLMSAATLMGPLMVAGPIFGAAAGALAGGVFSSLESYGAADEAIAEIERQIGAGSVAILVVDELQRVDDAADILQTANPDDVIRFADTD